MKAVEVSGIWYITGLTQVLTMATSHIKLMNLPQRL